MTMPAPIGGKGPDRTPAQRELRTAILLLGAAIAGLAGSVIGGFALMPIVRLVDMLTVIAGAVGAGAAFAIAVVQFRRARGQP